MRTDKLHAMPKLRRFFKRRGKTGRLRSHVDMMSPTRVVGWAMDPSDEARRLYLELRAGDRVVANGYAHVFRPDLLEAGIGDGKYGFDLMIPTALSYIETSTLNLIILDSVTDLIDRDSDTEIDQSQPALQLFDEVFYRSQTARRRIGNDARTDYATIGWTAGLNPHPLFDTRFYIREVAEEIREDPLSHFLIEGSGRRVSPHPLCDIVYCEQARPDVTQAGKHPLLHYLASGSQEDVSLSPFFDIAFYKEHLDSVTIDFGHLEHYLREGWKEGLRPHPDFDPRLFRRVTNLSADIEPLGHCLTLLLSQTRTRLANVQVSIIILNYNKTLITLQCLAFIILATHDISYEIIIVDNGSNWDSFALLCRYAPFAKILRSDSNLGFGEGCNLGAGHASGEFLCFLNNDAFVTDGWLQPLLGIFTSDPGVGAAGSRLLYPDGRLQEAGGWIAADGTSVQRGKKLDANDPLFNDPCYPDYCSAAALLVRERSFRKVLGFDLCFDPAYYEDVDLCLKLRLIGESTAYVPASTVFHLEHATAAVLGPGMEKVVEVNREKFVSRWGEFLAGRSDGATERRLIPGPARPASEIEARPGRKRLGLFTPYPLTPGGGERFLLSFAEVLKTDFDCTLLTDTRYSRERLLTLGRELDLELDSVSIEQWRHRDRAGPFDVFVCLSNEIFPAVPAIGRLNMFVCQFPFPMSDGHFAPRWGNLDLYDAVVVYSTFVSDNVKAAAVRLGQSPPPIHVLSPPILRPHGDDGRAGRPTRILNVGRFSPSGHSKRQDVMVSALRKLAESNDTPLELHLVGTLGGSDSDREYLSSLRGMAWDLPVRFHVNSSPAQIRSLYNQASIYWHMTGASDDVRRNPERFEHFGIAICEAMSAGVIPISLRHGGPAEIISDGINGYLVSDAAELRDRTMRLLAMGEDRREALREAARARGADFSLTRFERRLRSIIDAMAPPRLSGAD